MKNVVIVGAGPVGISAACVLKAAHPEYKITVIDKRREAKRNHGLSVQADSIAEISKILARTNHTELQGIFKKWSGRFVRTNEIERMLDAQAQKMGIVVQKGPDYSLEKGDLEAVLKPTGELTEKQKKLASIFNAATCIVAADGAHSVLRDELKIPLVETQVLQHMVELKYQTSGAARPRGYKEASKHAAKTGHIGIELVGRDVSQEKKSATFLMFINKDTFDALRVDNKGVYGSAWNFKELQELGSRDKRVQKVYDAMMRYVRSRDASIAEEQIATVELALYRNKESVKNIYGKNVLFLGDSNSGLILQRGFNKGLKEVALAVNAIEKAASEQTETNTLPKALVEYEKATQAMFREERSGILLKNKGIRLSQSIAGFVSKISDTIKKIGNFVLNLFKKLVDKLSFRTV